jgi:hypothetical protein
MLQNAVTPGEWRIGNPQVKLYAAAAGWRQGCIKLATPGDPVPERRL